MDGNSKADHMRMKRPDHDVWVSDGEGYFARHEEYLHHVKTAKYKKQVRLSQAKLHFTDIVVRKMRVAIISRLLMSLMREAKIV